MRLTCVSNDHQINSLQLEPCEKHIAGMVLHFGDHMQMRWKDSQGCQGQIMSKPNFDDRQTLWNITGFWIIILPKCKLHFDFFPDG